MVLRRLLCGLIVSVTLCACAGQQQMEDPIPAMTARDKGAARQLDAARQAAQRYPDDPRRVTALETMLFDRGYATEVRRYAVDELVRLDEGEFRGKIARRINLVVNLDVVDYICDLAAQRGWEDFTPVVVHSWARPGRNIADMDRPERKALQRLNPGREIEHVVFDVFANTDEKSSPVEQTAAWELLGRISGSEKLIGYLAAAPNTTAMVVDLKAAATRLHALPRNREGVLWLQYLRHPDRADFWNAAASVVARLNDAQRLGLELRHLPVLLRLTDAELATDRAALYAQVDAQLRAAELHLKGPTYDAPMRDWPQRLYESRDQLRWPDLATINLLLRAIKDREMVDSLFRQADKDLLDTGTEFGGVLDEKDGRFIARGYAPLTRRHDFTFVPPPHMIEHMYTALAHYHFHAQHQENSHHAGPGLGDLRLADRLNPNGLVFTFIDRNRLNVDYYQPGGTVIDLGTIRR